MPRTCPAPAPGVAPEVRVAHARRAAIAFLGIALAGVLVLPARADGQKTGAMPPARGAPAQTGGPAWAELNADQKEALGPLAADWDHYNPVRKKKWLEIAARYKDLSPEGQQRMHERMPELAKLTPEERKVARENFKHAYSLPPEQRRALTQKFQELPEEKKRELAEQARKKPGPPPRRGSAPAHPPAAHPGTAAHAAP
jgi:hypothetical protein